MVAAAAGALVIILILVSNLGENSKSPRDEPAKPLPRWRVFSVSATPLHEFDPRESLVAVENDGDARFLARSLYSRHWELEYAGRARDAAEKIESRVEIYRTGIFKPRLCARIDGRPWLSIEESSRKRDRPSLRIRGDARGLRIHGDLAERDYELRRDGKLVAMVTKTNTDGTNSKSNYQVELLRSEEPQQLLTVVLCLEAALPNPRH